MSKKTKTSRRPAFKLETLEQRQLLASIVGSGTEVNKDVTLANGGTYDQILMTGSTVTVGADAGQVTRVDFLDADGDITRVEFSGHGQLTVSLADFKEAATPTEYATSTKYVQGKASIQITGSDETSNVTIYSLGTANVNGGASNAIFADGKDGGNNWANVSRLVIESNGGVLGNAFGGIRAGNAVFGDTTGATGIAAPDIQFQGPIVIGGIKEAGTAVGLLNIGEYSANKTVTVVGTDLKDAKIDSKNVTNIIVGTGTTSMGAVVETKALDVNAFNTFNGGTDLATSYTKATTGIKYTSNALAITLDGSTTKAQLDNYATRFLNDVVIKDDFDAVALGATGFSAKLIGNVTVEGNLDNLITADINVGNVTVEGTVVDGGALKATGGSIGNVSFGDDVDLTAAYAPAAVITAGTNVGTVAVTGNVTVGAEVLISAGGNVGNISAGNFTAGGAVITATGTVGNLTFDDITLTGATIAAKGIGAISGGDITTGTLTIGADGVGAITASGDLTLGTITSGKGVGSISGGGDVVLGAITTAGTSGNIGNITAGKSLTISNGNDINSSASIGNISAAGALAINSDIIAAKAIGNITVTGSNHSVSLDLDGKVTAGTSLGNVSVASGTITSLNAGADFVANTIGNVSVTGYKSSAALLDDVVFSAAGSGAKIGNVTLDATPGSATSISTSSSAATAAGAGTGFSSSGNIGDVTIKASENALFFADVTGASVDNLVFRAGSSEMGANTEDHSGDTVSIGNVVINANLTMTAAAVNAAGEGLIIASGVKPATSGVFVSGTTSINGIGKISGVNGTIGNVTITEIGQANSEGFTGSALANSGGFTGGSVIIANAIGDVTIEAGDTVTMDATSNTRKGVLDTNADGVFGTATGASDLYVIVV